MACVPGRLLGYYLTPHNVEKMGRLFAEFHHHGAAWIPPAGFMTGRFEHWLSRGEENLITEDGPPPVVTPPPVPIRSSAHRCPQASALRRACTVVVRRTPHRTPGRCDSSCLPPFLIAAHCTPPLGAFAGRKKLCYKLDSETAHVLT